MGNDYSAVSEILSCYGFIDVDIDSMFTDGYINIEHNDELSKCLRKIFYPLVKINIEDVIALNTFWNDHPSGLYCYTESIKYFRSDSVVLSDGSKVSWNVDIICSIFNKIDIYLGICTIEDNKYIKHNLIFIPYKKVLTNSISKEVLNYEEFVKRFYTTDNIVYSDIFNIDYLEWDYTMCIIYNRLLNPLVKSSLDRGYVYGRIDVKNNIYVFSLYKCYIIVYCDDIIIEYRILNWEINEYSSISTLLIKFCLEDALSDGLFEKNMYKLQVLM